MRAIAVIVACAAGCGDNLPATDAGSACTATFAGGFDDTVSSPGSCAQIAIMDGSVDRLLELAIDSPVLGAQVSISIDLGPAPVPGEYSSEVIATWHAVEARSFLDGACVYSAGDQITPNGSFALALTAIEATSAHGVLDIVQYVHAVDGTNCGPSDTETIRVTF